MNKRQSKKAVSKMGRRFDFISKSNMLYARQYGKTHRLKELFDIVAEKDYKRFKNMRKECKK